MLEREKVEIAEERPARKQPLSEAEVKALLKQVDTVILARGAKIDRRAASSVRPDDLKGPSGNYRAPLLRRGKTLLVGFSVEVLRELL